ncbi:MAG: energy-coupling factor transporter ATPase [candidate division KSB1 bacterium]|nr:energy-coupling factor transporter ATPase [candidate division KSB1 bacterium]
MKIRLENISFAYNSKLPMPHRALSDINLEISTGEAIGIIGPSGSGKTTLALHFNGLLRPTAGTIYVDYQNIWDKKYPLRELRRKVGLVFQFPENQLFAETVASDVAFGLMSLQLSKAEIDTRVNDALNLVGLSDEAIRFRSPHELSEGEKRRVAIAGVLAMSPEVLIMDEPTACLDPQGANLILNMLKKLHEQGVTIIMISHNMEAIAQLAERIIILQQGRIFFDGPKDDVFSTSEFLKPLGLAMPRIVHLCHYLRKKQLLVRPKIYTTEALKAALANPTQ